MAGERYARIAQPGDCWPSLHIADHDGWLLLDGRTVYKADYPQLFAKLGLKDASAVLPDARDRMLMGAGGKLKAGETGGSSTLTLNAENLPAHRHSVDKVTSAATASQNALLTGVGLAPITKPPTVTIGAGGAQTSETGQGKPVNVPAPPHLALSLFVFAGRRA